MKEKKFKGFSDLKIPKFLKKRDPNVPIFYHHERCRCKKCKPPLKLSGEDGNAFFILGMAVKTAKKAGWSKEKIEGFIKKAKAGNYENLLQTCLDFFTVE